MSIIKKENTISEIIINNANISEIYYGNTLVFSFIKIPKIVFRDIDENGNLTAATGDLIGLFDEIKTIDSNCLYYAFYNCTGITGSVNFPTLTNVGDYGLYSAFNRCTGITSVNFPTLITIDSNGLSYAFYNCTGITGSVIFPTLTSVGSYGLSYGFDGCTGITSVSFPALTSVDNYGLDGAFNYCTEITELHFRADAKSVIENADDYSEKFGASNATIYFDL